MTLPVPARLVLVGSVIVDVVVDVPRLPVRGGDVLARGMRSTPGGGFNVLAAARRLGLDAALAGHVGDGANGLLVRAALDSLGVASLVGPPPEGDDTGGCVVVVEADGERTFITAPGCESRLTGADLARVELRPDDAVYVSGYELLYDVSGPAIAGWLADRTPAFVVLDPGPLVAEIPRGRLGAVLARTRLLSLNAAELAALGGDAGSLRRRLAPGGVVVSRAGAEGCTVHTSERSWAVSAPRVAAVDTTGAGDTHVGALLALLGAGLPLDEAARRATVAAAVSVTRAGGATGPTADELAAAVRATGHARDAGPRRPGAGRR